MDDLAMLDATNALYEPRVRGIYVREYREIGMPAHVAKRLELHELVACSLCPTDEDADSEASEAALRRRDAILDEWVFV